MATDNKIVKDDEERENKKGIIIFIIILALLLALFIGIRALTDKKDDKKKKEDTTEEVTGDDEVVKEDDEEDSYVEDTTIKTTSKVKRTSNKKTASLSLVLLGDDTIYVDYDGTYIEKGTYALDTKEGNLTNSVVKTIYLNGKVVDSIDTTNGGSTYTIKYTITNSRGDVKTVTRTVVIKKADVELTLNGEESVTLEYKSGTYTEEGAIAITSTGDNISSSIEKEITLDGNSCDSISNSNIGTYVITYKVEYANKEYSVERTIEVKDTTAPVITTDKDEYKYLVDSTEGAQITKDELEALFSVTDLDTNLTKTLTDIDNNEITYIDKTIKGEYQVLYTVKDSSNNETSKTITVKVMTDTTAPELTVTDNSDDTNYVYSMSATDDYSDTDKITYSYALVDDKNVDLTTVTWTSLTSTELTYTKAREDSTTAVTKYLVIKVADENGNEKTSEMFEIKIEPLN